METNFKMVMEPCGSSICYLQTEKMYFVKKNTGTHICTTVAYTLEMSYQLEILKCKAACRKMFALSSPRVT